MVSIISDAALKRERFLVFTVKNSQGQTAEQVAVATGQKRIARMLCSKRIKLLKTINKHLHHPRFPIHKPVNTDTFAHTVFGIILAHRWRNMVKPKLHRSHSLRHVTLAFPESPESFRKRSSSENRILERPPNPMSSPSVLARWKSGYTLTVLNILNRLSVDDAKELLLTQSRSFYD